MHFSFPFLLLLSFLTSSFYATLAAPSSSGGGGSGSTGWENKEHKHETWESSFSLCNKTSSPAFTVLSAVASPGSFAGRTGHSGSTKFTLDDSRGFEVKQGGRAKMVRQAWFYDAESDAWRSGNKETLPACEWTDECPIGGVGRTTVSGRRAKVPWYTPTGKYKYKYELRGKEGNELFCAEVVVDVVCPDKAYVCPGLPLI